MDTREAILARLVVVAGTVAGVKKVFRNELATNETDLPAIIVLDANEKADPTDTEGRGPKAPRRMIMMPQLLVQLPEASEAVGTVLNGFRGLLIDAVANDDVLVELTTNRQGARLAGTDTQLAWGRSMLGEMGIPFAIPYILYPGTIAG